MSKEPIGRIVLTFQDTTDTLPRGYGCQPVEGS